MEFDEILIGSGLSALAVAVGLPARSRVLVVGGPPVGRTLYYEPLRTVPCAHIGYGGLGNFWHGVIPTGQRPNFAASSAGDFATLFSWFYPHERIAERLGTPSLFVPWRPIRPPAAWQRLTAERPGRLTRVDEAVVRFAIRGDGVEVQTDTNTLWARRLWLCSGALQTPDLLSRSLGHALTRGTASDHVLCYLGQLDRATAPHVPGTRLQRTRGGIWFDAHYNEDASALVTLRPARFDYRRLDHGIEQRAAFGLPTRSAVMKIFAGASPGLVAEALYNRAGLFGGAAIQSVYAQLRVADAHVLGGADNSAQMRLDIIRCATDAVRAKLPWPDVLPSRRPELFIPMIHLHNTLDTSLLRQADIGTPRSPVQVADASIHEDIGPEHHSFKMMVAAFAKAKVLAA